MIDKNNLYIVTNKNNKVMQSKKLTKKEISENINSYRRNGFGNGFYYEGHIRGFFFTMNKFDLYEEDETGFCTWVNEVHNKKDVVNSIYEWFKEYAAHVFDEN